MLSLLSSSSSSWNSARKSAWCVCGVSEDARALKPLRASSLSATQTARVGLSWRDAPQDGPGSVLLSQPVPRFHQESVHGAPLGREVPASTPNDSPGAWAATWGSHPPFAPRPFFPLPSPAGLQGLKGRNSNLREASFAHLWPWPGPAHLELLWASALCWCPTAAAAWHPRLDHRPPGVSLSSKISGSTHSAPHALAYTPLSASRHSQIRLLRLFAVHRPMPR